MSKRFENYIAKISTLLVASVLLRVAQGFSSGKELPSLIREKRLTDVLDEPGDDDTTENKLAPKEENTHNTGSKVYAIKKDITKPSENNNTNHGESITGRPLKQINNRDSDNKNTWDNYLKEHVLPHKGIDEKMKILTLSKVHDNKPLNTHTDSTRQRKVILPRSKFGWVSQEVSKIPPPSKEMQHQMRMRMKRKKRRRLRALKRDIESKADRISEERQNNLKNIFKYSTGKKTTVTSMASSLNRKIESQSMPQNTTTSVPYHSKVPTDAQGPLVTSSLSTSSEKPNADSSFTSKQLPKRKKQKEAFLDSSTPSLLKRPKRFPSDNEKDFTLRKLSILPTTDRFSALEITLKSKTLSLNPDSSTSEKNPESSGGLSPSLAKIPPEDLEVLTDFFSHAGSRESKAMQRNKNVGKKYGYSKNTRGLPEYESNEETMPRGRKYAESMGKENRNKDDGDYELKLLEFKKKTLEDEERRLNEELRVKRQKVKAKWENKLKQLDQKNEEKEKEVHYLFEKFRKTDKQNRRNYMKKTTQRDQNAVKRSFTDTNTLIGDVDDDVYIEAPNRQKRKMSGSKDNTEMIKKQRTINAGGDSGNDDEITEVAFYDKQDEVVDQNKIKQREKNKENGSETKSGIDETSSDLMENNGGETQNSMELQANENKERQVKEKETKQMLEDSDGMGNADLMENQGKIYDGDSQPDVDIHIDTFTEASKETKENQTKDIEDKQNNFRQQDSINMANSSLMESNEKKYEKESNSVNTLVDDEPNLPVFTEIKDSKSVRKKNESNLLGMEMEQETVQGDDLLNIKMRHVNNNNHNHNDNNNNSSSNNSNKNKNNISSNTAKNNNIIVITNKKELLNENEDDVLSHDKRLLYILTGEGDEAKPSKTKANNANKMLQENQKEMIELKKAQKVLEAESRENERAKNKQLYDGKPVAPKQMIISKGLKSKINEMHNRILNAHNKVSKELGEIEQELSSKFESLQESLSMAKSLTDNVDSKINNSVHDVMKFATSSAKQAKIKLQLVQKAAAALNNIEEKIGANETRNFARILKSKLPDLPIEKNQTYKKILALNKVITKMDGARIIALEKANNSYYRKANIENSMSEAAINVLDELQSTEKELSDDTEMEIEDEIEADRKIRDAKTRNYKAAVKTAQALKKIEGYLKQLENDENKLRNIDRIGAEP